MSTMPGFCLALLFLFASVQALTIDDLLTPQAPVVVGPSSSTSTLVAGSIILGGDREIEMINGASVGTLTGDVTAGQFTVSFAGGLAPLQTTGSLRWDGTGNPANTVDLDLAPVDLTAGGATGLFYTSVATVNHLVGLQVWTGVGNTPADACSAQLFGSVGTLTQVFPFATLPAPGGGFCDMTNVFALELSVQPLGPGDVIISNIVTDGLAGVCQNYSPSQTTDGCGSFCATLGTITQTKADFGCNPTDLVQIVDVNAVVSFLKTDGTCSSPDTGNPFHAETNYRLDSGAGINVILANPGTWSGSTAMGSNANVIFDQGASSAPSGTPTTGTFLPNGGNLNALNGQIYCGDVSHSLVAGDTFGGDPLCTSDFCVDVSATCVPNSPPVLSGCQAPSVNLNMAAGLCCATASFGIPTATDSDPCGSPSVSQTFGAGSGACVTDGASVQFTATDNFGATDQCSWTYNVFDAESPSITCPADEAATNDPGQCSAVVSFSDPSVTDNCPGSTFSGSGLLSGGTYPVGSSTNTFTGSDAAGNDVTCTMSVVVSDTESPTITCPADESVANDPGNCGALVSFSDPVVTDNCPGSIFSGSGLLSGGNYPVGTSTNVFTGTDATGLTAVCSMVVEVFDSEAPTIVSCPSVAVVNDVGICGAVVSLPTVTFDDNCAIASVVQQSGLASGSTFPVGSTSNGFLATDTSSLTNTCTVTVTVSDTENPVYSGCSNINRNTDLNQCSATVGFSPSASDNCGILSDGQIGGPSSGSSFPVGATGVSFQAQDFSLNTETCSFTINVSDNQNPVVAQCPSAQTVNNAAGTCAAVVTYTVGESDNCPGALLAQTSGLASGASFPVGTTSNQFVATDASGNVSPPCNFDVTVRDVESPSIVTCPTDITLNNAPGACSAVATFTVQAADNCPGAVFLDLLSGFPSGSSFPVGTTLVQIQAVDGFGNRSPTCAFNVRVADVESPTIICPADINVAANADGCSSIVNFSYVTSDNCLGSLAVTSTHQSGDNFVGITDVTGTATDSDGNSASCTFRITVDDSVPPEISCFSATANTSPGLCTATVFFRDPDAFDVCGVDITRTGTAISGETYTPGSYSSTFTATDPAGNFDSCVSEVDVFDIEPPVVTGCPADITVTNPSGCDEPVTWDDTSVDRADNCGVVSSGQSHASGSTFPRGLTTVSYTATDSAGNVGQCSFVVRVVDNEQISYSGCPASFTVPSSCSDSGTPVDWEEPVISRVECLTYQSRNFAPGSRMPDGVTSISYTAVADEEWATCLFEITVEACPAESGGNRPPGAIGTIDLDGDGYYSDAPLIEWRDCCDSPEDHCDDPYLVNPGAFEIAANDQQDSCRGISETNDADGHIGGCDRNFISANDFQLVGPLIPSEQTNEAVWAMDLCEFKEDDDDPSWGFDEQQTMIFSLSNGTRNGYDIGIVGPAATQAAVLDHYGGIVPARGDFMLAISSGTARDETTGGHQSPVGATTGNSITNLPPRFLDSNAATFIEDCGGEPYAVGVDSIRAHFRLRQPTNMNAFSFQALYMDFELEAAQGSYPALDGTCDADRKSWFLAIKSDSNTGVSGNFAGDATGRSFNSFNANPAFWSQCDDYGDFAAGLCREGSTSLELTGFTGASNWTPIGTSAEPGETFSLEFVTFDGQDGANDVTVLLDDFFPITEARTAGSSAWASQPWGYQYTADLEMVHFGVAGGSPLLAKTVTSVSLEFTLRNWGPEEANDVTVVFTPPLGARFTAAKDSTGASLSCVTQAAAAPYVDNSLVKCKWATNAPMANQATLSGSLSFALDLDCAACPQHTRQMRFRLTSTLSSIDRQLSNNYLTTDVVFV